MKTCTRCGEAKPLDAFAKRSRSADGLQAWCRTCMRSVASQWDEANPERARERARRYAAVHPEVARAWAQGNPVKVGEKRRRYAQRKPHVGAARCARRKASKLRATPPWADTAAITALYARAALLTRVIGDEFHVDHIVPLQGADVCGLHVPCNLRIVLAHVNTSKHNNLDEPLALDPHAHLACPLA